MAGLGIYTFKDFLDLFSPCSTERICQVDQFSVKKKRDFLQSWALQMGTRKQFT